MGLWVGSVGLAQAAGIGFAETEAWVNEANPSVSLRVLRGGDDTAPFTVDYQTVDWTARAGEDFVAATGTLEFAEGEISKLLVIELINDGLREGTEQFRVTLSNPSGGRRVGSGHAAVNIEDNDPGMGFAGNDMWFIENQSVATLTVRRGSDSPGPFTVQYATGNGTAPLPVGPAGAGPWVFRPVLAFVPLPMLRRTFSQPGSPPLSLALRRSQPRPEFKSRDLEMVIEA